MNYNIWMLLCLVTLHEAKTEDYASNPSIALFQQYIQINTTTANFTPAVQFWQGLAANQNLPINVYEFVEGNPVIVIKWAGVNSTLSSIMLNSHMDVVPANEEDGWTYPPFSAYIDENGDIYGRGTQDMKSVSIQYYEALSRLKANNVSLLRDVYMTLMPDEEIGGLFGMVPLLESEEFAAMNVGVELDEGRALPLPMFSIIYYDKTIWQIKVDCFGPSAHGSTLSELNSTAAGKCYNVMTQLFKFREEQYEIAVASNVNNASSYTSINLTKMSGGTANNVIPNHVSLTFDIRLGIHVNVTTFEAQLERWMAEAGDNVTLSYILKADPAPATRLDDTNPYWTALINAADALNITLVPTVSTGATDGTFVRAAGIPALGFSPMSNTTLLAHAVNERLNAETFLQGIDIYEQFIQYLANVSDEEISNNPSNFVSI